jgi:hypothetical protein
MIFLNVTLFIPLFFFIPVRKHLLVYHCLGENYLMNIIKITDRLTPAFLATQEQTPGGSWFKISQGK